jgi:hypothetical protein
MATGALTVLNKFTGLRRANARHDPQRFSCRGLSFYVGNEICTTVKGGEKVSVPLYLSSMSSVDYGKQLRLSFQMKAYQRNWRNFVGYDGLKAHRLPTLSAKRA